MRSAYFLACASLLLFGVCTVVGQVEHPQNGMVKAVPFGDVPIDAKVTGLGGRVLLRLLIDGGGKVLSAELEQGPDWVCPSTKRPDVVALRNFAKTAALNTEFPPAVVDGKPVTSALRVAYDFPGTASGSGPIVGSRAAGKGVPANAGSATPPSDPVLNGSATDLAKPKYPAAARAVRASGAVNVRIVVDREGNVFSAEAIQGHPLLRAAARIAACESRFAPTSLNGLPVNVSGVITFNFVP